MIDIDKYEIRDDVVWVWNDYPDEEGLVLWEYKECPAEKGGYTLMDDRESDKTYEPWFQVLPSLLFQCEIHERMQAIMDLPLIIQEVKRLRDLVGFAIAAIDSNHCYMGEEAQADLRDYLKEAIE